MKRRKTKRKPLGTIWEIPDTLWQRIEPILKAFWPRKPTGRRVADWRKMIDAIIFRFRSGCQWDQSPERFGPKSTVHDWFQRWVTGGVFEKIWAILVAECDELGGMQRGLAGGRRHAGQGPVRGGKRRARTPPTAARRGPRRAW
jgi:putative transposase